MRWSFLYFSMWSTTVRCSTPPTILPTAQQISMMIVARPRTVVKVLPTANPISAAMAKPTKAKQDAITLAGISEHSFAQLTNKLPSLTKGILFDVIGL